MNRSRIAGREEGSRCCTAGGQERKRRLQTETGPRGGRGLLKQSGPGRLLRGALFWEVDARVRVGYAGVCLSS